MKTIGTVEFKDLIISGVNNLKNSKERINSLNVFPVPDGDTGSNMVSTLDSGAKEIMNAELSSISEIAAKFARGALIGARGNSGVILSQIFKGFSVAFKDKSKASVFDFVEAFKLAKEYSYKSVMEPVEGTMLTVIRMTYEHLQKTITAAHTFHDFFRETTIASRKACDATPSMLKVLKEAGVTDSGGEGVHLVFEGMLSAVNGKFIEFTNTNGEAEGVPFIDFDDDHTGEFGYCTEFVVELKKPKKFDKNKYEEDMSKLGNSLVVVVDEEILKSHIHTLSPGKVFTYAQKYGEFIKLKSENMTLQANKSQSMKQEGTQTIKVQNNKIGVIACNSGTGISNEMRSLGANIIIEGGQTNNPSTQDFLEAIKKLGTDNVIILPNNSNIILVAQQVVQTVTDKNVIVIPSRTPAQGLTALLSYNADNSLEENEELMLEGVSSVKTGLVSIAVRDTKMNGVNIKNGQYIGIAEKEIVDSKKSKVQAAISVVQSLADEETELITI